MSNAVVNSNTKWLTSLGLDCFAVPVYWKRKEKEMSGNPAANFAIAPIDGASGCNEV